GSTADSTLFFISRFRLGLREGMAWDAAVDYAILTVGDGMIMGSLILAGGFLCLASSGFLPTAHFGGLVTLSVLIALYLDMIVDPIVLKLAKPPALAARR
ncbi:MAG TPA: MMPL family transporter, partial [bacterium]|nr:MMPL family transporter [bacterium]